jgi:hypothetical protein
VKHVSLALFALLALSANLGYAATPGPCDAALILSTYNSFSSDHIDWRLATFVSEKEWEQIKHDQGSNAVVYGIPMGETYSDFQNRVKEKVSSYQESLTHNQMLNILWTGLDPNGGNAYRECLQTQLFSARGVHVAVVSATKNDISLLVSWSPQGKGDPPEVTVKWLWAGEGKNLLPTHLVQGTTSAILPRPADVHTLAVNYPGFTSSVVLEPLAKLPQPLPELQPVLVTETYDDTQERSSGECDNYSTWYAICTPEKPAGWKIVNVTFSLTGDRGWGGPGAQANVQSQSETRACWQFRLQGHSEQCGNHGNTGIQYSRAHLTVTWQHPPR